MAKSTYQMDAERLSIRSFAQRTNKDDSISPAHVTISGTEEDGERQAVIRVNPQVFDDAVRRHIGVAIDERIREVLAEMNTTIDGTAADLRKALRDNVRDIIGALKGDGVSASSAAEEAPTRPQASNHGHNTTPTTTEEEETEEVPPVTA